MGRDSLPCTDLTCRFWSCAFLVVSSERVERGVLSGGTVLVTMTPEVRSLASHYYYIASMPS